eukprot:RCo008225
MFAPQKQRPHRRKKRGVASRYRPAAPVSILPEGYTDGEGDGTDGNNSEAIEADIDDVDQPEDGPEPLPLEPAAVAAVAATTPAVQRAISLPPLVARSGMKAVLAANRLRAS